MGVSSHDQTCEFLPTPKIMKTIVTKTDSSPSNNKKFKKLYPLVSTALAIQVMAMGLHLIEKENLQASYRPYAESPQIVQKVKVPTVKSSPLVVSFEEAQTLLKVSKEETIPYYNGVSLSKELQQYIYNLVKAEGLGEDFNQALIFAIIENESHFNANSVNYNSNGTTDSGLMQINSCHEGSYSAFGVTDIMNPEQNLQMGIRMIGGHIRNNGGNVAKGLMSYHFGSGEANRRWSKGIHSDSYVTNILSDSEKYKSMTPVEEKKVVITQKQIDIANGTF